MSGDIIVVERDWLRIIFKSSQFKLLRTVRSCHDKQPFNKGGCFRRIQFIKRIYVWRKLFLRIKKWYSDIINLFNKIKLSFTFNDLKWQSCVWICKMVSCYPRSPSQRYIPNKVNLNFHIMATHYFIYREQLVSGKGFWNYGSNDSFYKTHKLCKSKWRIFCLLESALYITFTSHKIRGRLYGILLPIEVRRNWFNLK